MGFFRGRCLLQALTLLAVYAAPMPLAAQDGQSTQSTEAEQERARAVDVITVSATRLPLQLTDIPTAAFSLDGEALRRTPALVLDEALRWQPQFSLFRRTSSRSAHPTSQGLNLRGLAPSGVSRALVLVDGVPMNDAFGGWIYWDRVPLRAIERVEVALGGGSAPWGNFALGGVMQIVTRQPSRTNVEISALAGDPTTLRAGLAGGSLAHGLGLFGAIDLFRTDGYINVPAPDRGAIDTPVGSSHASARLRLDLPGGLGIAIEGLTEDRDNGTPEQTNDTRGYGASLRWSSRSRNKHGWQAIAHGRQQVFRSRFSSIAADRNSERPVLDQRVPSADVGVSAFGWKELGSRSVLSVGADWRRVSGRSEEQVLTFPISRNPGGTQKQGGAFVTLGWALADRWMADVSLRADAWRQEARDRSASSDETSLSPRAGLVFHAGSGWIVRAAAYRAFRAPTLNELYRQFRVGNVITRANSELTSEHLAGFEGGLGWDGTIGESGTRAQAGLTIYWNRLEDAVVNATLFTTSTLVFRQRRNLGEATIQGLELNAGLTLPGGWHFSAAYSHLGSIVDGATTSDPDRRLPQVPTHRGTVSATYQASEPLSIMAALHRVGEQFEDDLNQLALGAATTVDAAAQWNLSSKFQITVRGQNLFDEEVPAARTPILRLGEPRTLYAGLVLQLSNSGAAHSR